MKEFKWNLVKSERLKRTRGMSFEDLTKEELVRVKGHPGNKDQHLLLFRAKGYIWVVPCVIADDEIFLKTLYPSRKYTRMLKRGDLP